MLSTMKLVNNTNLDSERNLCFVNTALQLLYSVPRMKSFFQMKEYRLSAEQKRKMQICDEISRLFSSDGNFLSSASVLRQLVATRSGRNYLKDGTQQDTVPVPDNFASGGGGGNFIFVEKASFADVRFQSSE